MERGGVVNGSEDQDLSRSRRVADRAGPLMDRSHDERSIAIVPSAPVCTDPQAISNQFPTGDPPPPDRPLNPTPRMSALSEPRLEWASCTTS